MPTPFQLHLEQRGLTPTINVWVDWAGEVLTFPLWGWAGKLVGYQRYRWRGVKTRSNAVDGKYFTWVSDRYKDSGIYGREYLGDYAGPVFIVEGAWNAVRVINCGYSALAMLTGTPPRSIIDHVRLICGNRPLIAICDNDASQTGLKMGKWTDHYICSALPYKDIGELTQEQAHHFLERFQTW